VVRVVSRRTAGVEMKGKGMGMGMEKGRLHRQRVAIASTVQVQSKFQSWTGNTKYQIRTAYSECSWGFEERSGANPATPSLPSVAARQHWTPPRISYRRDAEGRSCGRGAGERSDAADGGNLDLTNLEPCPALLAVACLAFACLAFACLPCLDEENLARLRVVDLGSGLLSACAVAPLCCAVQHSLTHSLTPSLHPGRLWHAVAFHRYPTLSLLAPLSLSLSLDPGPDPEILAVAAV
jgi:hypothetical protein